MLGRSSPALEIARTGIGIAKVGIGMARVDDKLTPGEAEKLAMILSGTEEALHEVAASSASPHGYVHQPFGGFVQSSTPDTPAADSAFAWALAYLASLQLCNDQSKAQATTFGSRILSRLP